MRVAALTMAYNENVWARVWAAHYARELGAEHCTLIDHGSDDGSTEGLGIRVERIARSALDEDERAALIGARVAALLERYDAVIHSDADELVLAEPLHGGLAAFAAGATVPVVTAIGLDLQHLPAEEPALDPSRPLLGQRRWVRFSAAMCKPVFVRRAVRWSPGFHACDAAMVTGGLYLIHLRYADLGLGLRRLARTRAQAFVSEAVNPHQRVPDAAFEAMVRSIAQLPRVAWDEGEISGWVARVQAARAEGGDWLSISGDRLWAVPDGWPRF